MRFRRLLTSLGLIGCTAHSPSTSAIDPVTVKAAIQALDANAMRLVNSGHGDSLATQYFTTDAVATPPNGPAWKGAEAIRAGFAQAAGAPRMELHWVIDAIRVSDSLASTQGTYTFHLYPPTGDTTKAMVSDHGNYVTVFVRTPQGWRALFDIVDSEIPLPTPTPTSTAKK